jgi:hypothetical protein
MKNATEAAASAEDKSQSHLAAYVRSLFSNHSQTVRDLVAAMPDAEIISKWHESHATKLRDAKREHIERASPFNRIVKKAMAQ